MSAVRCMPAEEVAAGLAAAHGLWEARLSMAAVGLRGGEKSSLGCSGPSAGWSSSEGTGWDRARARLRVPDVVLKASARLPNSVGSAASGTPARDCLRSHADRVSNRILGECCGRAEQISKCNAGWSLQGSPPGANVGAGPPGWSARNMMPAVAIIANAVIATTMFMFLCMLAA